MKDSILSPFNAVLNSSINQVYSVTEAVRGVDRHRYFYYPQSRGAQGILHLKPHELPFIAKTHQETLVYVPGFTQELVKTSVTVACQTMYRESCTQTAPYSPEFLQSTEDNMAEILAIKDLKFGPGLPASQNELEQIDRIREKRIWDAKYAQADTMQQTKMDVERHWSEWKWRESKIHAIEAERLALVQQARQAELDCFRLESETRLAQMLATKNAEKEKLSAKIEKKTAMALRKIQSKKNAIMATVTRTDRITSQRQSQEPSIPRCRVETPALDDIRRDLDEIYAKQTDSLNMFYSEPVQSHLYTAAKQRMYQKQLKTIHDGLTFASVERTPSLPHLLEKIVKPAPRPATAVVDFSESDDHRRQAAILIQRLIRGKQMKKEMHDGLDRRSDLIVELRLRPANSLPIQSMQSINILSSTHQIPTARRQSIKTSSAGTEIDRDSVTTHLTSEYIGRRLDFLQKELEREQEHKRITAMVQLAHNSRLTRESQENYRRKVELAVREKEHAKVLRAMGVHDETIETYLENIVLSGLKVQASIETRGRVKVLATKLSTDESSSDDTVLSLMQGMFGMVEKEIARDSQRADDQKFVHAASDALRQ